MMIVVFLSIFLTIISILLLLGATMLMVVCSNTLSYLLYILINPRPLEVLHINDRQPHPTYTYYCWLEFFNIGNVFNRDIIVLITNQSKLHL